QTSAAARVVRAALLAADSTRTRSAGGRILASGSCPASPCARAAIHAAWPTGDGHPPSSSWAGVPIVGGGSERGVFGRNAIDIVGRGHDECENVESEVVAIAARERPLAQENDAHGLALRNLHQTLAEHGRKLKSLHVTIRPLQETDRAVFPRLRPA